MARHSPLIRPSRSRRRKAGKSEPGVDLEHALADLLDADADAVPVHRLERKGLQNEHVERALHEAALFVRRTHACPLQ